MARVIYLDTRFWALRLGPAGHFPWRDQPDAYWMSLERFVEALGG